MSETLFHPPLWMPLAAILVAIAVFIYGNARVKTSVRNGGFVLLLVTIGWCVAAYFIETRVEKCVARTHAIVAAVEKADWKTLGTLLDKTTVIDAQARSIRGREEILAATEATAGAYSLKSIRVYGTDALEGPGSVDVSFNALLEGVQPLTATFRFEYEDRSDGMLLNKIVPVKIGDKSMQEISRAIR